MTTINPADCLPHEVYEGTVDGERWTMQRVDVGGDTTLPWFAMRSNPTNCDGSDLGWYADAAVSDLVRLVPARPVTRDDLPPRRDLVPLMYETRPKKVVVDLILNAVMDRLNANGGLPASSDGVYGIPREDYGYVDWPATCAAEIERADRAEAERDRWRRAHAIVEQERDQAREQRDEWKARAEKAATVIDGLKLALANRASRTEAAERERDEAIGYRRAAETERDDANADYRLWVERAATNAEKFANAERECDEWRAQAEAAPTVTRKQVEDAINRHLRGKYWDVTFPRIVDAMCDLFGIEAEQPDPVEAKARELYGAANAGTPWGAVVQSANEGNRVDREVVREYRAIAAHVLGQETSDE